jgi:glycosyltransferase involved in cell wall biosynthesis
MFKLFVEAERYLEAQKSGVGYYEQALIEQLERIAPPETEFTFGSFTASDRSDAVRSQVSGRVVKKLQAFGVRIPAEWVWRARPDAYIFPDFILFPSRRKKPTAVLIHDLGFRKHPEFLPGKRNALAEIVFPSLASYLRRVVPYAVHTADVVIVSSETAQQEIMEAYGIPANKFVIIGIPPHTRFKPKTTKAKLPRKLGIPTDKYLYFQGTLEPRKNQLMLLDAYARLPEAIRTEYSLVMAGKAGWNYGETTTEIERQQATGANIVLKDFVDESEQLQLYQHASLYVQPSHYEGFGMPLLEAMACDIPVVCSDIPIFREVCDDGAVYFDHTDPDSMAKTINESLQNISMRKHSISSGRSRVKHYRGHTSGAKELLSRLSKQ